MLESTNITVQSHYIITLFQKVYDTQIFQLKPLHFFGGAMLRETSGVFHIINSYPYPLESGTGRLVARHV